MTAPVSQVLSEAEGSQYGAFQLVSGKRPDGLSDAETIMTHEVTRGWGICPPQSCRNQGHLHRSQGLRHDPLGAGLDPQPQSDGTRFARPSGGIGMTREERAMAVLQERWTTAGKVWNEDALKAMLQFADAEAAAMRERAAGVCDGLASSAANIQAALELYGSEAPTKAIQRECATTLAAAIRALPATGEE